ncbi:8312_t:CDS:10 [Ambispora gerdemannii]|uniref:8312_t:CDS:1 n=1 Tax=Ambispora gerdemannii TaxID=144530 RepID=A0A9N8V9P6_9GLOM|nr:8312_t:CDS:10 [Ambispora gerdemannii]
MLQHIATSATQQISRYLQAPLTFLASLITFAKITTTSESLTTRIRRIPLSLSLREKPILPRNRIYIELKKKPMAQKRVNKKAALLEDAEREMLRAVQTPLKFRMVSIPKNFVDNKVGEKKAKTFEISTVSNVWGAGKGIFVQSFDDLAQKYQVHAIDLLGWGRSSRPRYCGGDNPKKAQEWWVESIEAWRIAMGIEKFTLVGHSMGGYVSASYALKYRQHLDKLVLISPIGLQGFTVPTSILPSFAHQLLISSAWSLTPQRIVSMLPRKRMISFMSSARSDLLEAFPYQDKTTIHYFYNLAVQTPISGEAVFKRLGSPLKGWHLPLKDELHLLGELPVQFVYGENDWMDPTFSLFEIKAKNLLPNKTPPNVPEDYGNNLQGWVLSIASGLACCLGASVVFSDLFLQRFFRTQQITQNTDLLVASLSLGSGVLAFSSLYNLLPEARMYADASRLFSQFSGFYVLGFYFLGSNSLEDTERSPLLLKMDRHTKEDVKLDKNNSDDGDGSLHGHGHNHHFPHFSKQKDLEENKGLITFITSQASPTLGFALFLAIAVHNISEGVTIALPLYVATNSRIKSFLYASLLGGLSQPFGAFIGWAFIHESYLEHWDVNAMYSGVFACVSGLMSVIAIQGMLPQAIKNDTSDGTLVNVFFFLGVLAMGLSSALFAI